MLLRPFRFVCFLVLGSVSAAVLAAQGSGEAAFLRQQAAELHRFAKFAFDSGFPKQARRIWQELLKDYDPDHAAARAALGFKKLGSVWHEDEAFDYPSSDNPDGRKLGAVERRWNATRRKVGLAHKKMGETFRAAGRSDRARWHFDRARRFLPENEAVQAASGAKSFYGLSGSELEQQLYERSRRLKQIVAAEQEKSYEVKDLPSTDQTPYLIKAGIAHAGYKTEHYTVWSNMEAPSVRELAQNIERSRSFCSQVFVGHDAFHPPDLRISQFIFLGSEKQYHQTLRANQDLFRPELLEFLVEHTGMCDIGKGVQRAHLCGDPNQAVLRDLSIRWPVGAWGAMRSDALNEGLGHAVVALFFRNITVYSMDLETQAHTVTKRRPGKVLVPDVESWQQMAIESAFRARGEPLAKMPLINASNFSTESRVRAWSYCDYLLRRDPRLLLELDHTRHAKSDPAVRDQFRKATGIALKSLDKEWSDFWTGATPVLAALRGKKSPYSAASRDAAKWLAAFNKLREQYRPKDKTGGDVTWNAVWSLKCKQHAEYLLANRRVRGPGPEQTQETGAPGATRLGALFAQMALVATKSSPTGAMKNWIDLPGYRDAIIDPHLMEVGLYAQSGVAVFDVLRGIVPPLRGVTGSAKVTVFPPSNAKTVPVSVARADLGPEIDVLLKDHAPGDKIGYPISLHAWRAPAVESCKVTAGGKPVIGIVHKGSRGINRRTSAPGMAVFYPVEPFGHGVKVKVEWRLVNGQKTSWQFTTK